MKKVMISLLAGASVLALVACTPKRYERQSKPKTATSSAVKKEKKDTGQKYYQEVLERYAKYDTALKNGDKAGLFAELGKIQSGSEESIYLDALERLGTPVTFQYAFTDLNKDGVDELLVSNQYTGNKQYVSAIYYLKGQKAELLHTAYTAAVGGYRSSLEVFDNGQIVYATWQSLNPEMELTLYSLGKGEAKEEKKATIQIEADGHTWGKLESGQGWIALEFTTRVDGSKSASSSKKSSGMNIQEIQNGNFSSIAGTWRNGKGMSVTFDDNGISKINGEPTDQVVDRFNHEFGYLSSSVHSTAPAGASAMSFFPAGQEFPASLKYGNFSVDNSKDIIYWGQNVISDQSDLFYKED